MLVQSISKTLSLLAMLGLAGSVGCGEKTTSFDLLAESTSFSQSSAEVKGKIDILWVVDNSGSMATSQAAVAANFQRFIQKFQEKGYDFQIAVTTSDAYKDDFNPALGLSTYSQGTYVNTAGATVTAPKILNSSTPELEKAFAANIKRGVGGNGDERTHSSMKAALSNVGNLALGFPRPDAFLTIVAVSDEDDFSWNGLANLEYQYNDPRLVKPEDYVSFLDTLTSSTANNRRHNYNAIAIFDEACRTSLGGGTRKVAVREGALANLTGGILGSLCDDFGTTMAAISNKTIELSTQFYLERVPAAGSLRIWVNGVGIPEDANNGFQYRSATNSITFHGSAVPPAGSQITVAYDPTSLR